MRFGWISFTTDYGLDDGFVAACTGIIARIAPQARVIDVSHGVPPQDVRRGATVLAQTAPYLPAAVHLAVVDPGVGTARRGVAVVAPGGVLVGPDNGLLIPAAEALGGVQAAHELASPHRRGGRVRGLGRVRRRRGERRLRGTPAGDRARRPGRAAAGGLRSAG
ncbi:SAM-dependent chlorinase/fluorinase [Pseudonocardia sp. K10HN5]|uniref:SAM-dependent chlorinase/fluorinase n=1 Tax=Pseudonocardia acidicola TaxID=2724939 RepID=A0ABX1SAP0_9PSEU|nr:SAM-dependent chlorinase/fluorinase [Pseudonocardia acidicola]